MNSSERYLTLIILLQKPKACSIQGLFRSSHANYMLICRMLSTICHPAISISYP